MSSRKLKLIKTADKLYRELAPDSAGCVKCDDGMEMITDHHHKDGSVCIVAQRNHMFGDCAAIAPLGRYDPGADPY